MEAVKKSVFITGASSYIGGKIIDLLPTSYEVIALENIKRVKTTRSIKIINGNLENLIELEKKLPNIDTVIHLAGITHSKNLNLYKRVNRGGTINLIDSCKRLGVKQFIFISTRAIGKCCGAYGVSKEEAENYLKKSGMTYTILRVGEAYDDNFSGKEGLSNLAHLIKRSFFVPYLSNMDITLAPIHITDIQKCIVATIDNPKTFYKTYTVAGPEDLSLFDVVKRISDNFKLPRFFIPIPTFIIKIPFILGFGAPDQLNRFLCKKELLSKNVVDDLKIIPRKFLSV